MARGYQHASKPFTHMGVTYPSRQSFCTTHGLHWTTFWKRLKQGITDERLTVRRLKPHVPIAELS